MSIDRDHLPIQLKLNHSSFWSHSDDEFFKFVTFTIFLAKMLRHDAGKNSKKRL
jgi:hypothetical protein